MRSPASGQPIRAAALNVMTCSVGAVARPMASRMRWVALAPGTISTGARMAAGFVSGRSVQERGAYSAYGRGGEEALGICGSPPFVCFWSELFCARPNQLGARELRGSSKGHRGGPTEAVGVDELDGSALRRPAPLGE
jgi:hypothetical protein